MKDDFFVLSEDIAAFGNYPGSRSIEELLHNGIIILDKWCGPTSHEVSATVKKILERKKTAHAGTLDPQVSGVLPIMLENACKVMPALQKQEKEYVGVMHLHKEVNDKELSDIVKKFIGVITQKPPVRSAVARKERKRTIKKFEILERNEKDVLFLVSCEAGTYIRKLVDDLGKQIGGAHMTELRRTRSGIFNEQKSHRIQDIADAFFFWKESKDEKIRDFLLPVEASIENTKKIIVKDSAVKSLLNGSPLYNGGISRIEKTIRKDDLIALLTLKGELIALAKANTDFNERTIKRKQLVAKTDRVIMSL